MVFILAGFVLLLDQSVKFLVVGNLSLNQSVQIIPGILHLTLVYNRGAAFGILKNQVLFFILTSLIAIILIIANLKKNKKPIYALSLSLILGGALGNLTDRLFLGCVVDFIDLRIWPVFNIADSSITIGAILLGWSMLRSTENRVNSVIC